jgi:uncharacterized membrane protein YhaH (DUF805 family)
MNIKKLKTIIHQRRMGRLDYTTWSLVIGVPAFYAIVRLPKAIRSENLFQIAILGLVILIVGYISHIISVRRAHDLDYDGKYTFSKSVPIIGLATMYEFFFKKGTSSKNRFGPPPVGFFL